MNIKEERNMNREEHNAKSEKANNMIIGVETIGRGRER
jgi:hypothetical protein